MGFGGKWRWGLLAAVLCCGAIATGRVGQENLQMTVRLNDSTGMSLGTLHQAETEAARIFHKSGIDIAWVDCSGASSSRENGCNDAPGATDFVLHIVATGRTSSEFVFGLSFLAEDGTGKYADIFFDRLERTHAQSGAPVSVLLGTVAAHELGHLLLGLRGHSCAGIMTAVWRLDSLRQIGMGTLMFSSDQASRMRERLRESAMAQVDGGKSSGK